VDENTKFFNFDVDQAMRDARASAAEGENIDWEATRRNLEGLAALRFVRAEWAPPGITIFVLEDSREGS
jgi:hypothetical protein